MKYLKINNSSVEIPVIGQGTGIGGAMATDAVYNKQHKEAISYGASLGLTFIDTSESYGRGKAEKCIGEAIKGVREKVFISTKCSPENASYGNLINAAKASLMRLQTDHIDLFQLHWPNPNVPIEETMKALEYLVGQGLIKHIGVSNFSLKRIKESVRCLKKHKITFAQLEYNIFDRSAEDEIMPFCADNDIKILAYSPIVRLGETSERAKVLELRNIAKKYGKTTEQIMLNWIVGHFGVIALTQSINKAHISDNAKASDFTINNEDIKKIGNLFYKQRDLIETNAISVSSNELGMGKTYHTLKDALDNSFDLVPSPKELAKEIIEGEPIRPVRLKMIKDKSSKYKFSLIEGRLRYWGWVIAHEGKEPIPAYVNE